MSSSPKAHSPERAAPPAALQGGVSFSAHCSRPSARPAPPPSARSWGGGGDRRGRDGRRCSRRRGLIRADTARDAAARRSSAAWLCASARLCGSGREGGAAGAGLRSLGSPRGYRSATREPRVTARPPEPPSGLPAARTPGPSIDPAATCCGPRGEDTMRSALALSALLLVLSCGVGQTVSTDTTGTFTTATKPSTNAKSSDTTVPSSPGKERGSTVRSTTVSPVQQITNDENKDPVTNHPPPSIDNPTESKDSGTTTRIETTSTAKSETTSGQNEIKDPGESEDKSSHSVSTNSMSPKEAAQVTTQPTTQGSISKTTPAPSFTSANPHQSTGGHVSPKHQGGAPTEQNTVAITSSSSDMTSSPIFTSQGSTTTAITAPLTTLERKEQTSSETPVLPGATASTAPLPRGTKAGPVTTPPVRGPTGSQQPASQQPASVATPPVRGPAGSQQPASQQPASTASTAPQGSNQPSTPALGSYRIKCEAPERPDEKMLILNLTKTNLCAKDTSDDKLVTVLCQAAKATFNPAQDQCHIRLAPVPESQAVIVKEITIQTILLPRDVYELLKNKWDDLKEAGISNMMLGDQGPPEEAEDRFSMPLIITIVCMASFLLLVAALYGCCHQRLSQRKDQQRLTEELQTVENGYHDNPTLEVMETSSEMQEKKVVNLNGELGDSWIVPLDNLTKDDLDEEEDTHL
ncbi:podocalyxin [Choloepus didactylus]|uniref:podocalyxin n=1 Tax=Choloepus didactylus TaxID=27675 RepID=UPI00189D0899|nr:podocalyxin [Choloepus didactylus]